MLEKKREIGRSKGASGGAGGVSNTNGESTTDKLQKGGPNYEAGPSARVEAMPRELKKEIPSRKRKRKSPMFIVPSRREELH